MDKERIILNIYISLKTGNLYQKVIFNSFVQAEKTSLTLSLPVTLIDLHCHIRLATSPSL
jgi:hypothetical protein